MFTVRSLAVAGPTARFEPFTLTRRAPGAHDVVIDVAFCGICHSDIHQARNEWGGSKYPMVPGHEIVGHVVQVGSNVTRYKVGDRGGVGCFVDSCRACAPCGQGTEQFCDQGHAVTYNGTEMDRTTPTQGGYSQRIVVDERYVLKVSPEVDLAATAPLLCAGITTYSPLRRLGMGAGHRVAVVGLGGLGHMAVKLAVAMGTEVTVLSTSPHKEADAKRLGAHAFALLHAKQTDKLLAGSFHTIVDTVSAPHDLHPTLRLLRVGGTQVLLGVPPEAATLRAGALVLGNKSLMGSLIGGIRETQEMLDFCLAQRVTADVEVIPAGELDAAYERVLRSDVKYRFSLDTSTL